MPPREDAITTTDQQHSGRLGERAMQLSVEVDRLRNALSGTATYLRLYGPDRRDQWATIREQLDGLYRDLRAVGYQLRSREFIAALDDQSAHSSRAPQRRIDAALDADGELTIAVFPDDLELIAAEPVMEVRHA